MPDSAWESPTDLQSRIRPHSLVANVEDRGPRGIPFTWMKSAVYRPYNELDPDDLLDLLDRIETEGAARAIRAGYMQFVQQSAGRQFQELLVCFDNSMNAFDRFVRIKQSARWSVSHLDFLAQPAQDWMIGEQIDPVPTTYMDEIRARVGEIGDPPRVPPVAKLLEEWANGDKTVKKIKRQQIADELDDPAFSSPHHRVAVGVRLRAHAAASMLKINDINQTYLEWFRDVLGNEEDYIAVTPGYQSTVKPRFERAGIGVAGQFAYTLSFNKIGGSLPVIKVGAYGFSVDIKREKLEPEKDATGVPVRGPDGKLKIKSRTVQYDTSQPGFGHYLGVFFEIGLGLGVSISSTGLSGGNLLGDVTFESSVDLRPQDFDQARFTFTAVKGPGAKIGNFVSFDSFTSQFVELVVANKSAVLSAMTTTSFQFKPPKIPKIDDLKDPAKYVKGWFQAKLDGKICDLSEGWGMILLQLGDAPARPSPDAPPALTQEEVRQLATRQIPALFAVDSAVLRPSGRRHLEAILATDRALLEAQSVQLLAWGYASPEQDKDYNLRLSQARAEAVIQAVKDAFGKTLSVTSARGIGLGEDPSLREGHLHDPEAAGIALEQWIKQNPDEVGQWPQWRRVDLVIAGQMVARVFQQPIQP